VYASDIDYDDEFFDVLDSFEKAENSCYAGECELIHPIVNYVYKDEAKAVAEDLHQTILRGTRISDFFRKYSLHLRERDINHIKTIFNYADEHLYELDYHQEFNISNLNDFGIENNIPLESRVGQEDEWDFKDRIFKHLKDTRSFDKLSLLFNFLQIGKFAFVEEQTVDKSGYLK